MWSNTIHSKTTKRNAIVASTHSDPPRGFHSLYFSAIDFQKFNTPRDGANKFSRGEQREKVKQEGRKEGVYVSRIACNHDSHQHERGYMMVAIWVAVFCIVNLRYTTQVIPRPARSVSPVHPAQYSVTAFSGGTCRRSCFPVKKIK